MKNRMKKKEMNGKIANWRPAPWYTKRQIVHTLGDGLYDSKDAHSSCTVSGDGHRDIALLRLFWLSGLDWRRQLRVVNVMRAHQVIVFSSPQRPPPQILPGRDGATHGQKDDRPNSAHPGSPDTFSAVLLGSGEMRRVEQQQAKCNGVQLKRHGPSSVS